MANEITAVTQLRLAKGNLVLDRTASVRADMTGNAATLQVQTIGDTYEALSISGDIVVGGYAYFRNLETVRIIEIGVEVGAAFYPIIKLKPGEVFMGRVATVDLFAEADDDTAKLEFLILED